MTKDQLIDEKPRKGDTVTFVNKHGEIQYRVVENVLGGFVEWENPNVPGTTGFAEIEKVRVVKWTRT